MNNSPEPIADTASGNPGDIIARGRNSRKQGNHVQALEYFQRALLIAPRNSVAAFEIGSSLCDLNRPARPVATLARRSGCT